MGIKICNKCNNEKNLEEFSLKKDSKDGYNTICKSCKQEYDKLNRVSINIRKREYRVNNVDKILEYQRKYYKNNSEKIKAINKNYSTNNKDKTNKHKTKYRENNRHKVNLASKNWLKKNPHIVAWRRTLRNCIIRFDKTKEGRTHELLGYSALEFKEHITSLFTEGMSWSNYGEWHIDHIIPVSSFNPETPMNIVNELSNLRPLWATTREINGVIYVGNLNKNKF